MNKILINLRLFVIYSPGFLRFVNVLVNMNSQERKLFLQFTTGTEFDTTIYFP